MHPREFSDRGAAVRHCRACGRADLSETAPDGAVDARFIVALSEGRRIPQWTRVASCRSCSPAEISTLSGECESAIFRIVPGVELELDGTLIASPSRPQINLKR